MKALAAPLRYAVLAAVFIAPLMVPSADAQQLQMRENTALSDAWGLGASGGRKGPYCTNPNIRPADLHPSVYAPTTQSDCTTPMSYGKCLDRHGNEFVNQQFSMSHAAEFGRSFLLVDDSPVEQGPNSRVNSAESPIRCGTDINCRRIQYGLASAQYINGAMSQAPNLYAPKAWGMVPDIVCEKIGDGTMRGLPRNPYGGGEHNRLGMMSAGPLGAGSPQMTFPTNQNALTQYVAGLQGQNLTQTNNLHHASYQPLRQLPNNVFNYRAPQQFAVAKTTAGDMYDPTDYKPGQEIKLAKKLFEKTPEEIESESEFSLVSKAYAQVGGSGTGNIWEIMPNILPDSHNLGNTGRINYYDLSGIATGVNMLPTNFDPQNFMQNSFQSFGQNFGGMAQQLQTKTLQDVMGDGFQKIFDPMQGQFFPRLRFVSDRQGFSPNLTSRSSPMTWGGFNYNRWDPLRHSSPQNAVRLAGRMNDEISALVDVLFQGAHIGPDNDGTTRSRYDLMGVAYQSINYNRGCFHNGGRGAPTMQKCVDYPCCIPPTIAPDSCEQNWNICAAEQGLPRVTHNDPMCGMAHDGTDHDWQMFPNRRYCQANWTNTDLRQWLGSVGGREGRYHDGGHLFLGNQRMSFADVARFVRQPYFPASGGHVMNARDDFANCGLTVPENSVFAQSYGSRRPWPMDLATHRVATDSGRDDNPYNHDEFAVMRFGSRSTMGCRATGSQQVAALKDDTPRTDFTPAEFAKREHQPGWSIISDLYAQTGGGTNAQSSGCNFGGNSGMIAHGNQKGVGHFESNIELLGYIADGIHKDGVTCYRKENLIAAARAPSATTHTRTGGQWRKLGDGENSNITENVVWPIPHTGYLRCGNYEPPAGFTEIGLDNVRPNSICIDDQGFAKPGDLAQGVGLPTMCVIAEANNERMINAGNVESSRDVPPFVVAHCSDRGKMPNICMQTSEAGLDKVYFMFKDTNPPGAQDYADRCLCNGQTQGSQFSCVDGDLKSCNMGETVWNRMRCWHPYDDNQNTPGSHVPGSMAGTI